MADYIVEIEGGNSLSNIELAIQGEEAAGAEFMKSSITFHENKITNLATFKELPPGQRPPRISLVKHGDPGPQGKTLRWSGVMVVSGTNTAVSAYR